MVRLKRFGLFFLVFLAVMLFGLCCTPHSSPSVEGGTLVGYRWDATTEHEEIISINATTGAVEIKATLDQNDPQWITDAGFAVDSANGKAYLYGVRDEELVWRIYTIDLVSGIFTDVIFSEYEYGPLEFYSKTDTLIGYSRNATTEKVEIISINATTGAVEIKATLGQNDPSGVTGSGFAVDSANDKAYLYGDTDSVSKIYTINLKDGTSSNVTFSGYGTGGFGFDSYKKDTLIGWRSKAQGKWEIISINATTGEVIEIKATLGQNDPQGIFPSGFAVDSANDKAYLYGDTDSVSKIYTIDLETGRWSGVPFLEEGEGGFGFDVYK